MALRSGRSQPVEIVLYDLLEIDDLIRRAAASHAARIAPGLHRPNALHRQLAQQDHAGVGARQSLSGASGYSPLADDRPIILLAMDPEERPADGGAACAAFGELRPEVKRETVD